MRVEEIRAYLNNLMSPDKRQEFEFALEHDTELAAEFHQYRLIKEFVADAKLLELKEKMKVDLAQRSERRSLKKILGFSLLSLALLSALFYNLLPSKNAQPIAWKSENKIERNLTTKTNNKKPIQEKTVEGEKPVQPMIPETESKKIFVLEDTVLKSVEINDTINVKPEKVVAEMDSMIIIPEEDSQILDPCLDVKFKVEYTTEPACLNQSDGKISISSVSGGKAPYLFKMGAFDFSSDREYNFVSAGSYPLVLKDANGCEKIYPEKLLVGSKECNETKEYSFSPGFGEEWKYPVSKHSNLKIYDKSGALVYEMVDDQQLVWSGQNLSGTTVDSGVYLFVISDSEKNVQGYISVLR